MKALLLSLTRDPFLLQGQLGEPVPCARTCCNSCSSDRDVSRGEYAVWNAAALKMGWQICTKHMIYESSLHLETRAKPPPPESNSDTFIYLHYVSLGGQIFIGAVATDGSTFDRVGHYSFPPVITPASSINIHEIAQVLKVMDVQHVKGNLDR